MSDWYQDGEMNRHRVPPSPVVSVTTLTGEAMSLGGCAGEFYVTLTPAGVTTKEETFMEKNALSDWPVGRPPLSRWSWVLKKAG